MADILLSAKLPSGEGNGLGPLVRQAISEPETVHTAIVLLTTKKIVRDVDEDSTIPVMRILRAEVVSSAGDLRDAERLVRRALERRTGQPTLDFEQEAELEAAFRQLDLKEGTGLFLAPDQGEDEEPGESDG